MNREKLKQRIGLFIEFMWIFAAILSLAAGIHKTYYHGFNKSWLFYLFSVISVLMYFMRKNIRKQLETEKNKND